MLTRALAVAALLSPAAALAASNGHSSLIQTSDLPPGDECPTGGTWIETGVDDGVPVEATDVDLAPHPAGYYSGVGAHQLLFQTFIPTQSGSLTSVELAIGVSPSMCDAPTDPPAMPGDLVVELHAAVDGVPFGAALAASTLPVGSGTTVLTFDAPATVQVGLSYALVIATGDGATTCSDGFSEGFYSLRYTADDYVYGQGGSDIGGGWRFDGSDYAIKTTIATAVGADDGVLSPEEIDATSAVCNGSDGVDGVDGQDGTTGVDGADGQDGTNGLDGTDGSNGHSSLVDLVTLDAGDEACAAGGTRIATGLDNGDGGETADDGVLGAGEVDTTTDVCAGLDGAEGEAGPGGCNSTGTHGTLAAAALAALLLRRRRAAA